MAFDITDFSNTEIFIDDGWRTWYIPKFRIYMTVDGDFCNVYWTDTERGSSGLTRRLELDYHDVTFNTVGIPTNAGEVETGIQTYIDSGFGGGGGVQSVTGLNTDNTDPQNPVVQISVDGVTITGDGTPGNPLVSVGGSGDVVGPASAVDSDIALFDTTTGKLIKDSGVKIADILTVGTLGSLINGAASATPVDADLVMSINTSVAKKNTWTQIKAFLKTYFDTIYIPKLLTPSAKTTDFTLTLADAWTILTMSSVGSIKATIPLNSSVAFAIGTEILFQNINTGLAYFEATAGVTIQSYSNFLGINGQYNDATLVKTATNTWWLYGNLRIALDADAEIYINAMITAGGSFTDAQKGYINTYFLSIKAGGVWTKRTQIFPFLGLTAATCVINAKSPGTLNGSASGTPTFNINGMTTNGSSNYMNTNFNPSVQLTQNNKSYTTCFRSAGLGSNMGALDAGYTGEFLSLDNGGTLYWALSVTSETAAVPGTKAGVYYQERTGSTVAELFRNDVSYDTDATASSINPNFNIYLGCRNVNGAANNYSADNIDYWSAGTALSAAERTVEYNAIVTLNTAFGR